MPKFITIASGIKVLKDFRTIYPVQIIKIKPDNKNKALNKLNNWINIIKNLKHNRP